MNDLYDVIVVGAGPAGASTAHYLATTGCKVLLLDKFTFPRDKTCGDALTPRALRILDEMGVLAEVEAAGHRLDHVAFFAPGGYRAVAPLPRARDKYGYLLFTPRLFLDHSLARCAIASGAELQAPVHVTSMEREGSGMLVKGVERNKERAFRAQLVVLAVGANTKLLLRTRLLTKMPNMMLCARTYYEGVPETIDAAHCRFDGVPLPGYGWVFPISRSAVNVGVGLFREGLRAWRKPKTAHAAFATFIGSPPLQEILAGAQQTGPLKGYPLRVDFARSPTFGERTLLVGEAAGLVNPVTGEGIDYALESGKLAAEHLTQILARGDFSINQLAAYDEQLRQHYQRLFVLCDRLRFFYLNPLILNQVVRAVARSSELMEMFMNIAIENQRLSQGLAPGTIAKVLFIR